MTESSVDPFLSRDGKVFVVKRPNDYVRVTILWFWHSQAPPKGPNDFADYMRRVVYRTSRDGTFGARLEPD